MTEMVEFFKLSYYSYRGGKKLHQICSATWIYRTVFELKNILASMIEGVFLFGSLCLSNKICGSKSLDFIGSLQIMHLEET